MCARVLLIFREFEDFAGERAISRDLRGNSRWCRGGWQIAFFGADLIFIYEGWRGYRINIYTRCGGNEI